MADSQPTASEVAQNAVTTFKSGDYETAVPLLRQAIEYDKENYGLHMYLGMALGKREKWADAEKSFTRATEIDGGSADAAYYLGVAIAKQGRIREAHGQFYVATLNDPNHEKAKSAESRTRAAAEQVTQDGSSAVQPGGMSLTALDFSVIEMESGAAKGKRPAPAQDDVAAALQELKGGSAPAKKGKPAAPSKGGVKASGAKSGGCGSGIVALLVLGSCFSHAAWWVVRWLS